MTEDTTGPGAEPVPQDRVAAQASEQVAERTSEQTAEPSREATKTTAEQPPLVEEPRVQTAEDLRGALEALLLIADEPVSETNLAATLRVPTDDVRAALDELVRFYDETGRGFELRRLAGGWRYYTRDCYAEVIEAHVLEGQTAKLSQAAMETLAVIAYLQPVSRSRVSAVRGVNVDGVVRTLLARDLICESGAEDSGATLFRTTDYFLERMGLQSLDELPELAPYLPEAMELEAELGQLAVVPSTADEAANGPAENDQRPGPAEGRQRRDRDTGLPGDDNDAEAGT